MLLFTILYVTAHVIVSLVLILASVICHKSFVPDQILVADCSEECYFLNAILNFIVKKN